MICRYASRRVQGVLDIRHFYIQPFGLTSLLNCYPNFVLHHENDVYLEIIDVNRILLGKPYFEFVLEMRHFQYYALFNETNCNAYRGLSVL